MTEKQRRLTDPDRMVYLYYSQDQAKWKVTGENGEIHRSALVDTVPDVNGRRKEITYTEATTLTPLDMTLPQNANKYLVGICKQSDLEFLRYANEKDFYRANAKLPASSKPQPKTYTY
jgi:hypothetical protein